jgi:CheY-like chemotaxis protein
MDNKILIVDDEEPVRDVLTMAFSKAGYTVVSVATAEEALEVLRERTIRVIFLDLKLPGMNGLELCKLIRQNDPFACIFALTGYACVSDLLTCRQAGFDDCFPKPARLTVLLQTARDGFEKLERWKSTNPELTC